MILKLRGMRVPNAANAANAAEQHRIAPIGLDSVAARVGDRQRRHRLTMHALCAQVTPNDIAARA
jgi:hypothetical protein